MLSLWLAVAWRVTLSHEGSGAPPRAEEASTLTSFIQSHGNIFSSEFLSKARSLLSLEQKGLMYISQWKVCAHKISYKYGEYFLDHRNIISKKYYNLTIKLVLEVEPSWWDFLKKCLFKALMANWSILWLLLPGPEGCLWDPVSNPCVAVCFCLRAVVGMDQPPGATLTRPWALVVCGENLAYFKSSSKRLPCPGY